jgi:2-methylisocitrate lyase-like PEP mutase family enzyme
VLNARIDVHLRGGRTPEALERARAYADAAADCVYPIGIADEETIGVARVGLGDFLHAERLDAFPRAAR